MNGIKCFITSKKALSLIDEKKYSFLVHRWMKKDTLKTTIENFFNVKVIGVNTFNLPRKKRRLGKFRGYKPQYKKAIVTLDSADTLQLFSDI
jgi:large subunit ribosomal protein L23